jgi:hypothetical protein
VDAGRQRLATGEEQVRKKGRKLIYGQVADTELTALGFYSHHGYVTVATPMELPLEAGFGRLQPPSYYRAGQMIYKRL